MNSEMLKKSKIKKEIGSLLAQVYTLFSLIAIIAGKMYQAYSIEQISLSGFDLNISFRPIAVIFVILIIIIYLGYKYVRAKFISVWLSAKIFSFPLNHENEDTSLMGDEPALTLQSLSYLNFTGRDKFSSEINSFQINVGRLD